MDQGPMQNLELEINALRKRVYSLEEALKRHGIAVERQPEQLQVEPPIAAVDSVETMPAPPATGAKMPGLPALPVSYASGERDHDLENRIGSQWFNRIGILAVLIGIAWFLNLAIDNHWIGPAGQVLIVLAAGAALIAWSERFRSRGYPAFSYSLKAIGSGLLYLALWAAFSHFHLIASPMAFAAMIVVTAFNGFMSWQQDAELLALYSIAGALSTPLLLSEGGNHEVTLFSYLFMLDVAVLVLVILKPWSRLLFAAFVGTVLFFAGWWFSFYSVGQAERTAFFVTLFFLMFALAPRVIRLQQGSREGAVFDEPTAWDHLSGVILPVTNGGLGFLAYYALVDRVWAPWLAVAFAAFYLGMLKLPEWGLLRRSSSALYNLQMATAVVFLTVALPLKAEGRWLTIGWLAQGAALLWVASRIRSRLLRVLAVLCLLLGLVALIVINPTASLRPIFNDRFAAYTVGIAAFALAAWLGRREGTVDAEQEILPWRTIAPVALLMVNVLILLALSWEIHEYWWSLRWTGNQRLLHDTRIYAQFTYSALFMTFGAVLLAIGFWNRSAFVRWQALVLLALAIGKVFLADVSALSQGYRVLSFLGLGALLLGVSFVYQRDWLNLRGRAEKPSSHRLPERNT